jgi:dienelactone hydrolase
VGSYGTWASPLSAATVATSGLRLSAVSLDGDDIYWLEGRPREGGRYALVRRAPDGAIGDITPPAFNVRTGVHEYGGGAYVVVRGIVYCVNFADQRVYRIVTAPSVGGASERDAPGVVPEALTPPGAWRYADFDVDVPRGRLLCVREDHTSPGEPVNTLAAIPLSGPMSAGAVLVSGADFYSTPRLSPDGSWLAWLSWNHPRMPWDGTELWVAGVDAAGALQRPELVAGGPDESIYQPGWAPDGALCYVSDRTGWWQIYRRPRADRANADASGATAGGTERAVTHGGHRNRPSGADDPVAVGGPATSHSEFGRPQWVFGTSTWACAGPSTLIASYARGGHWHLATFDVSTGVLADLIPDWEPHDWLAANATHAVLVAGSATRADAILRVDLRARVAETVREAALVPLDSGDISQAEAVEFPTAGERTAHAFYYPPHNPGYVAPAGERPPLIVIGHGGPTSAARPTLDLHIQYWTTRGFAVVDVNYGGSSGFGRAYRERLNGQWGIVDVDDVVGAARFLAATGRADGARLAIRGGSAGGYTTLAAVTFRPGVFKAGASYYGISDLEALEIDTHKFEARYSNGLIGPYPAARATYQERSPIHALDQLACPLILFQGLEDPVVPPNQSQRMADAVRAKGLPVAYLAFEGEQHGFRRAETIVRCLEAELFFYGAVFGFTPADPIAPVHIDNL